MPLAYGKVLADPVIEAIAARLNATAGAGHAGLVSPAWD
jgi:hypothetical protein